MLEGDQTSNVIVEPNLNFTWPIHDLLNQTITLYLWIKTNPSTIWSIETYFNWNQIGTHYLKQTILEQNSADLRSFKSKYLN